MKKLLIILFVLLTSVSISTVFAQTNSDSVKITKYVYCQLTVSPKAFGPSLDIKTDFGVAKEGENQIMKEPKTGKQRDFNSIIDVLNYMSENGWDLVSAYTEVPTTLNCVYLLRKIRNRE